jgi:glycosyltransferase involved in cell wall biosynthesis
MGFNQGEFMRECAQSVLSQNYEGKLEIIFCDDCSTDNTFQIMKELAETYQGPHRVIVHQCPINGKVATNMNVAVSL